MMPVEVTDYARGMAIASPVYLDANILISRFFRNHAKYVPAMNLLFELSAQQVEIYISTLVMDEVWWGLLGEWYHADTDTRITTRKIRSNPDVLSRYRSRFQAITSNLLNWQNIVFLPTSVISAKDTVERALDFLTRENIQPRDSFHLALATLSNAAGFVTSDSDFDNIALPEFDLIVYKY
jgi:predicted nucleic acid-binding protein